MHSEKIGSAEVVPQCRNCAQSDGTGDHPHSQGFLQENLGAPKTAGRRRRRSVEIAHDPIALVFTLLPKDSFRKDWERRSAEIAHNPMALVLTLIAKDAFRKGW